MSVNSGSGAGPEARALAKGLRDLRESRKLTTRALADASGQSSANVSHWESGNRLPSEERLQRVLDALDAPEDERERLLGLRRRLAEGPGQLVAGAPSIGAQLVQLIEYEQVATRLVDVEPLVIPGLLQTADYARATFAGLSDVDTRVALRMGRRDVITRVRQPAELVAYIDTEVLVRPVGTPDVMVDQMRHLLEMGQRPNVQIRLVSSTTRGYTPMQAGAFLLMEFPAAPPVVHVEQYSTAAWVWDEQSVRGFYTAVEKIDKIAMTPARSAEVIAEYVNGMEP
jgi:transcriptional regulator with XRE-family HTH domain